MAYKKNGLPGKTTAIVILLSTIGALTLTSAGIYVALQFMQALGW